MIDSFGLLAEASSPTVANSELFAAILAGIFLLGLGSFVAYGFFFGRYRDSEIDQRGSSILLGNRVRTFFALIMRPVWTFLVKMEVPPNAITSVSLLLAIAGGVCVATGHFALGGCLYLLSGICDFLDGRLARITNMATSSGAALDSILDRYSEAAMLVGLAWFYRSNWVLLVLLAFFVGSVMVSYIRARGEGLGAQIKAGLMQRPERLVILGVAVALSPIVELWTGGIAFLPEYTLAVLAIVFLAVTTQYTAAHRFYLLICLLNQQSDPGVEKTTHGSDRANLTLLAVATVLDGAITIALVQYELLTPWLATAIVFGVMDILLVAIRRSRYIYSKTIRTRQLVVTMGSLLLNSGGVAVLSLIPVLPFWSVWMLTRLCVLIAWNYPMRLQSEVPQKRIHRGHTFFSRRVDRKDSILESQNEN